MAHDKETITAFLDGVVGVVEATSYEHHMLWREYAEQAREYAGKFDSARYDWIGNLSGLGEQVGTIADRPIWISLLTAIVGGHKLLFWHVTSPVADHDQCDAWLHDNLPATAFREDGYINRSDPMNFSNVFPRSRLAA